MLNTVFTLKNIIGVKEKYIIQNNTFAYPKKISKKFDVVIVVSINKTFSIFKVVSISTRPFIIREATTSSIFIVETSTLGK